MIIKTYPAEHLHDRTVADWVDPLLGDWPEFQGCTHLRILWTEEKLSKEDLKELRENGYTVYVTDQPLGGEDGPGFGHSMFFNPRGVL